MRGYAQTTHLMQFCTCGAQFCEHIGTYNSYRIPEPWTVLRYFNPDSDGPPPSATSSSYSDNANSLFSPNTTPSYNHSTTMFSVDATDISFTPPYMPSPSPNANPSYPYGDTTIFPPIPQPVIQTAITQIEGYSHLELENSSDVQYQDDDFSVSVQDPSARFHQNRPHSTAHGAETCTGQPE
ncbi:hypothetical protein EDD85DRAFT_857113 [Armillaria nabsnona]|nr:hypothetical protein EDD85DRAFT_857113 [Armillaria nabsnona]